MTPDHRIARRPSPGLVVLAGLFAAACLMAAPAARAHGTSIHLETDDDATRFDATVSHPGYRLEVVTRGRVGYAADERDVLTLSAGGKFELREKSDGLDRRLVIAADRAGNLSRSYEVDRDPAPFDGPARTWFAVALNKAFRQTGLDAEARAARLLAARGADGLLKEIDALDGDFVRHVYLAAMLGSPTLGARGLAGALRASAQIGSDFDHAEVLISAAPALSADAAVIDAWRGSVERIGSDFERRRVLEATFAHGARAYLGPALLAIDGIGSDFEKRSALAAAVAPIGSDLVLLASYLERVAAIGSDFEKREALGAIAQRAAGDPALARRYQDIAVEMGDFERNGALAALLAAQNGITL